MLYTTLMLILYRFFQQIIAKENYIYEITDQDR